MSGAGERTVEGLEREVAELRARLETVTDSADVDAKLLEVVHAGVVKVGVGGEILLANQLGIDFLGLAYDALTTKYTADFKAVGEDGEPASLDDFPVTQTLQTGKASGPSVFGVDRPDGSVRWGLFRAVPVVDDAGQMTSALVSLVDITARRRAEEKLRKSETRLAAIVEGSPTQIMFTDRDLNIQFLNRYSEGHDPSSVIGLPISEFLMPSDRERVLGVLRRVLETGKPGFYELAPNPPVFTQWFSSSVGPLVEDGEVTGLVINVVDITDRVELQSRLLVSDRLASQGTLAASVAHEINNPLTYVLANLQRVAARLQGPDNEKVRSWLDAATEGAERIRNVVRDLSSLSSPTDDKPKHIQLAPVLESSIRMAQVEVQHRAILVTDFDDVPLVAGDESRLGQVFLNLVINAAQSIPVGDVQGNRIEVRTRTNAEGWAVVEVSDTGEGISDELVTRIFEPFVTTKEVEGTGLGLYICASIVRSLGGRLTVENRDEGGSCFRVELPPAGEFRSSRRQRFDIPSDTRARILVIDDEPGVLEFMQDALFEHDVTVARTGREAIELLRAGGYDVVFCDLIMPEVSGMEVYRTVSAELPERSSTFVFMTGGAFTATAKEFLAESSRPLLEKPFDIADILDQIGLALLAQAT